MDEDLFGAFEDGGPEEVVVEALPTSAKRSSTTVSSSSGTSAAEEGNKRARGGPEEALASRPSPSCHRRVYVWERGRATSRGVVRVFMRSN